MSGLDRRILALTTAVVFPIAILLVMTLWPAAHDVLHHNDVSGAMIDALRTAHREGRSQPIRLDEFTDFPWDTLYIYGGYDDLDEIDRRHGTDLRGDWFGPALVPETSCLFVFARDAKTVHSEFAHYNRLACDEIANRGAYSKEQAVFDVEVRASRAVPIPGVSLQPPRR